MPEKFDVQVVKVMLWAQDMDRAVCFMRDALGLEVGFQSPHWSELKHGDTVIALHGGGDGTPNRSGLGFQVSDVEAACAAAKEHGATVLKAPETRPGEPIKLAELRDPDGNEWTLSQYIG